MVMVQPRPLLLATEVTRVDGLRSRVQRFLLYCDRTRFDAVQVPRERPICKNWIRFLSNREIKEVDAGGFGMLELLPPLGIGSNAEGSINFDNLNSPHEHELVSKKDFLNIQKELIYQIFETVDAQFHQGDKTLNFVKSEFNRVFELDLSIVPESELPSTVVEKEVFEGVSEEVIEGVSEKVFEGVSEANDVPQQSVLVGGEYEIAENDEILSQCWADNVEKLVEISEKAMVSFKEKRVLKPSPALKSPYINKKTASRPSLSVSEFSVATELFAAIEDRMEIVFETPDHGYSGTRLNLESLSPHIYLDANVIDIWSVVLNYEERFKTKDSVRRLFFLATIFPQSAFSQDNKLPNESVYNIFKSTVGSFLHYDPALLSFQNIDLVFFPICIDNHFYCLVFDIRKKTRFHILDNRLATKVTSKYKDVCDIVQYCFATHLKSFKHAYAESVEILKFRKLGMSWCSNKNNVDCGIFLMFHMESYMGQTAKLWNADIPTKIEEQNIMMRKLRMRFASKILTHDLNIHSKKMIHYASEFMKAHTIEEIKGLVLHSIPNRAARDK